ncbi:MAG: hypothetical protein ACYTG5_21800 [Planctomycetota bacterium]|jgi:hypothetical protein
MMIDRLARRRLLSILGAVLCLMALQAGLRAQRPLIVDAAGKGDFTELQPAVDAAEPGQLIRVRHGLYDGALITKSLRVIGDPYQQEPGKPLTVASFKTSIHVEDLPRGASVVIADLAREPGGESNLVYGKDCRGSIHVAYGFRAWLTFERCDDVVVFEHFGPLIFVDSTAVVSKSLVTIHNFEPALDIIGSQVLAVHSGIGAFGVNDEMAVHVGNGGEFRYDADTIITGGLQAPRPAIRLGIGSTAEEILDNYLAIDFQSVNSFAPTLKEPPGTSLVALAGSLSAPAKATAQGDLHLDAASFSLFYLGTPPANGELKKQIPLPVDFQPSRHFDTLPPEDLALPGAKLMGIPVTLQAAVIVNGEAVLSLPYPMVL